MHENTEFTTSREVEAIQIPSGTKTTIPAGTPGVITQTLGGSYTIATYQGLARIAEKDLDALGLEKPAAANGEKPVDKGIGEPVDEKDVWNQLRQCYDPEIPVNIVDLGLVYDCNLTKNPDGGTKVEVKMTLTAMESEHDQRGRAHEARNDLKRRPALTDENLAPGNSIGRHCPDHDGNPGGRCDDHRHGQNCGRDAVP